MNSEKPSKLSEAKLKAYEPAYFPFLQEELASAEMLFQTAATTVPYPIEQASFERYVFQNQCAPYVLVQNEDIIAYGDIIYEPGKELRLCRLVVGKAYRGLGYGKKLVLALVETAQEKDPSLPIYLFVIESNTAAKKCYEACGFKETELRIDLKDGDNYHPTLQMKYHGH